MVMFSDKNLEDLLQLLQALLKSAEVSKILSRCSIKNKIWEMKIKNIHTSRIPGPLCVILQPDVESLSIMLLN